MSASVCPNLSARLISFASESSNSRELREAVRARLARDEPVQPHVLQGDGRLGAEPQGELPRLVAEIGPGRREEQHRVLPAFGAERDDERLTAHLGVSGPRLLLTVHDQTPARGAGRLDGALDDDVQEREGVVGGGQGLPEPVDRVLHAPALGGELAGHLVEGATQGRELVAAPHGDALPELAAGDGAGGIGELPERAHDRPAEQPSQDRNDREGEEGEDEEALAEGGDRVVDRGLRRDHDEGEGRAGLENRGGHCAVTAVAEVRVARLGQRRDLRPDDVVGSREDLTALCEQDSVRRSQAGDGPKLGQQGAVEREPDGDAADQRAILR
jgi:hypothetical protein